MGPQYFYQGHCPETGKLLRLPRTEHACHASRSLMAQLGDLEEGKMFGVLLTESEQSVPVTLKAFSGHWQGRLEHPGWAPPLMPPRSTALETATVARLGALKRELSELGQQERAFEQLCGQWQQDHEDLRARHAEQKAARAQRRLQGEPPEVLAQESREQGREWRLFRTNRAAALEPLQAVQQRVQEIKKERRRLSRTLQAEMHADLDDWLFGEVVWSLNDLFPTGIPTGTGDCCAPKLLVEAARRNLRPLGMAEFWWGPDSAERRAGEFYTACKARCQPLLGALLTPFPQLASQE